MDSKAKFSRRRHLLRKPRSVRVALESTDGWWNNVKRDLPNTWWKINFRMSKEFFFFFFEILDEVKPLLDPKPNCPNYRFLLSEKKLAITLYYLKDTGSLWMTANTFGIHQCTVSKTIVEVCKANNVILDLDYLHLPRSENDMRRIASEFELDFGMPQAFGCKRPIENLQDYYHYKFSLNVQTVCDSRGRFIDVECKWPGSVLDAKVFANSTICKNLRENLLPITYSTLLPFTLLPDPIPNYVIGDPAYPLTPYSMKEYQSNSEVVFNNLVQSARNLVECSTGRLKARWGFLRRMVDLNLRLSLSLFTVALSFIRFVK